MGYRIAYSVTEDRKGNGICLLPVVLLLLALLYRLALASDHPAGMFSEIEDAFASLDSWVFHLQGDDGYGQWYGVFQYEDGSGSRIPE